MEADIARHYPKHDFHDYLTGRREHGAPVLSFRRLLGFVRHMPVDSACADIAHLPQVRTAEAAILASIFQSMTGVKHPLTETEEDRAARRADAEKALVEKSKEVDKVTAAKARTAQRKAAIAAGQIE